MFRSLFSFREIFPRPVAMMALTLALLTFAVGLGAGAHWNLQAMIAAF